MTGEELRRQKEAEKFAVQRQIQHDQEFEKAIENYVKKAAIGKEVNIQENNEAKKLKTPGIIASIPRKD